jgi:sugar-specific transcriptional regulator TrmB
MHRIALKNLGLKESEIRVYLALLNLGTAKVGEIAKKANMYNKNTYDALKRLNDIGIISKATEEGKLVFHAEDPEKLFSLWESRREHLVSTMEELKKLYRQAPSEEEIFTYKGRMGIKSVFDDVLKADECMEIGDVVKFKEVVHNFFLKYQLLKKEKKMKCRAIISSSVKGNRITKEIYGKIKFAGISLPSLIVIYSNKVVFIHFGEDIFETIVKSKKLHEEYVDYFNSIWDSNK